MQYKIGTASLTNGTNVVTGNLTAFLANVKVGDSIKVQGESATYQIIGVSSDTGLLISPNYAGATASNVRYQIMRDRTPNLGLAEINAGDEDWPYWLTQETIRKLDTIFAHPKLIELEDVYVGPTEPTDPTIRFWIDTSGA